MHLFQQLQNLPQLMPFPMHLAWQRKPSPQPHSPHISPRHFLSSPTDPPPTPRDTGQVSASGPLHLPLTLLETPAWVPSRTSIRPVLKWYFSGRPLTTLSQIAPFSLLYSPPQYLPPSATL